jgi:membrane protease YdiL (CAAX protease family)
MNQSVPPVICLVAGFLACQFIPLNGSVQRYFRSGPLDPSDNSRYILFQRSLSVFVFGFIPLILIFLTGTEPATRGLNLKNPGFSLGTGIATGVVLVFINFLNRRNPGNLLIYPQIRKREWPVELVIASAISWLAYLLTYEFMLRGYLLFSMAKSFGTWNAVTLNLAFYSLIHVPKGWKEAIGSLPLGFLLCMLCLHTGNIWPAFIAHSFLALSNEWFALANHPDIFIRKPGNVRL